MLIGSALTIGPNVYIRGTKESNRGQVILLLSHGQLDHPDQIGMCDWERTAKLLYKRNLYYSRVL